MRQNTNKFKPNPSKTSRLSIRSSSIRDIIGHRRFNHQFSHVNPHRSEGTKKVKRTKVDEAEADDLPNLGQNASSSQCEAVKDPRRCCGDFAAKTSEYAFFKKVKETTSGNTNIHPKYHDNQLKSDHSTREEIPNVQKESIIYARPSSPVEKEQDDAHYAFLTPVYRSKNSEANNVLGVNNTNAHKVTPGDYNWLSPSMGRKAKTSGTKGVFSMKREKLQQRLADKSLYDVNELSLKGTDLVSALISRLLPEKQEKNCKDETDSKYKLPSFSESEAATLIKGHDANKRKFIESHPTSYPDDDFPRSSHGLIDTDLLESNPNQAESFYIGHAPKCIQYDHYHSEAYKRNWIKSHHISYVDDGFQRSSRRVTDMDLLEWNPNGSESCSTVDAPKSSIEYDRYHSEAYKINWIKSHHTSYVDDRFQRSSGRVTDMDLLEWNPNGSESCSTVDAPKSSFEYDRYHSEAYKRNWIKSHHTSYVDDRFQRSPGRITDMDLLEWHPNGSESCLTVDAPKSCFKYDHYCSEPYKRKFIESQHMSYLDDGFPRSSERDTDVDCVEQDPSGSESFPKSSIWYKYNHCHTEDGFRTPNFKELEDYHFDNEAKLLEQPRPLLLGWEDNSEKDEFQAEINTFATPSTSQYDDYQLYMPIDRHLKEDPFMSSSIIPYTPKHVMPVEDCSINNYTWCLDESSLEKEESFRFLLQAPAKDFIRFLHSSDEKEKNFMCSSSPGDLLEGRVKSYSYIEGFDDKDFDLLLHSNENV